MRMGKEPVVVKEAPGFVTTRINALIGNEAFRMLEEGVASAPDIDKALKLGLNHPMGPFELVDLVGLDTRLSILEFLFQTLGERYRPNNLTTDGKWHPIRVNVGEPDSSSHFRVRTKEGYFPLKSSQQ